MREINGSRAPECADEAMRDALPALDHGRLPVVERQAVESHVAVCASCAEELALLRDVRLSMTAAAPALDLDRLARSIATATRPVAADRPDIVPIAPRLEARRASASRRWLGTSGLRAAAAAVLMVAGVGAVTLARRGEPAVDAAGTTQPVASSPRSETDRESAPAPAAMATAEPRPATTGAPTRAAHLLGQPLDDLSDAELDAVLLAIDDEDASLPALEPAVHASEYRGGGA